ncbi:MAG: ABC transporter permease subunit, partial [Opitutaceae bacterium]
VAVGMTLVIFCGGIDLSVGAVIGFTSILMATLVQGHGWHPASAAALALVIGAGFGAGMGWLIHHFNLPSFLITLAGMFLARGAAFWISTESIGITHPLYRESSLTRLPIGMGGSLAVPALIFLAVFAAGYVVARYTRFGRGLLAVGGNEQSALLMGLPVGRLKIGAYVVCSSCAVIAGLTNTLYSNGGNGAAGLGLELDAIAIVVIGGTVLTGGRGHMLGTLLGVLIYGTIQTAIDFDGRLNSWWTRIVVGVLLLAFILLQRLLLRRRKAG